MDRDMTVPCEEGFINIRVGAIIMKNGIKHHSFGDGVFLLKSIYNWLVSGDVQTVYGYAFCFIVSLMRTVQYTRSMTAFCPKR